MSQGPGGDLSAAGAAGAPGGLAPETTAEQLAGLAAERPDLWPEIWQHPNCYDGLRQWMADRYWAPGADPEQASEPVSEPAEILPQAYAPPEVRKRRTVSVVIAVVLILALVLGGGLAALALTGNLDRWFGWGGGTGENAAETVADVSFAGGLERMWTADSNDYVTPMEGELGQDFSYLRSAFSRGSIGLFEADYPVATASRVVFNARGEDSKLVMLDAATGDAILEHDLDGLGANCAVDDFAKQETVYCISAHDQRSTSTLLRIDATGGIDEQEFDLAMHRVAVGKDRIVLAGDFGAVVAVDRSMREIWQRDDLPNGGFAGVDVGGDRTLIRGYDGWTLLGEDGSTLATAEVVGPYDGGDGACDARLTESGKLFVASDDACVDDEAGIDWWGFGENLLRKHFFSSGGRDYVLSQDEEGAELLRFPESEGEPLETVIETGLTGEVVGVTGGERPVLVMSGAGTAVSFALSDGEEVARWSVAAPQRGWVTDQAARSAEQLLLDDAGTALLGDTAYDVHTGDRLWSLRSGEEPLWGWMSEAGLIVLGGGCPECSIAGGAYTSSTLTLYAPEGSGGEPVTTAAGEAGSADQTKPAKVEAPDFIPSCPAETILLAWAEFSDGWVVVCGIDIDTPTYVQLRLPGQSKSVYSVGASKPTSERAKSAVSWDRSSKRYTVELTSGETLVLDHRFGTATVRDEAADATTTQQRMIRYIFVPLGTKVRTSADSENETGAYGVRAPKATAEDQIRFMIEVLEKAYEGRALVKEALPSLAGCSLPAGGYGGVIADMKAVRDNRAELLVMLDGMPVDQIPEGRQLLDDLRQGIQHSYDANVEYVAWAEAANASGCASLSAAGQASVAASDPPKERFAERWNRAVAPAYGVRSFDAWYI